MTSTAEILAAIAAVDRDQLPALMLAIAARMAAPPAAGPDADELIDARAAARILGISVSTLYHDNSLPFIVKVAGRRKFSRSGIQRFIEKKQGKP